MFSLSVNFGAGNTWVFLFTKKESIEAACVAFAVDPNDDVFIADDYGNSAVIRRGIINGWLIENMELSKGANIYRNIHMKRMEAEFMSQFQADPALANLRGGGPGILSPFPRQGRAS